MREMIAKIKTLDFIREYRDKDIFNQSLLSKIQCIESITEEYILDSRKLQELKGKTDELYNYLKDTMEKLSNDINKNEISKIPMQIETEMNEYEEYNKKIVLGEKVFTEEELAKGISVNLKDGDILYFSYSSEGDGIYFEIKDKFGKELDGGIQLWGLENMQPKILQERLINSLLTMCGREEEKLEDWKVIDEENTEEVVQAKSLPQGWNWIEHYFEDPYHLSGYSEHLSGYLKSPEGKKYFSYDRFEFQPIEFQIQENEGFRKYYESLYDFKGYAEKYITENILGKIEENYKDMKERHQEEFNSFPIKFAFSDEQFKKAMEELGLNENDKDKIVGIGAGGFMKKEDVNSYKEMNKRHNEELSEAIKKDIDGTGFVKEMFLDELINHEYGYTREIEDTLTSLGITIEDLNKNENLKNGLELAKQEILQYENQEEDEEEL